ncbi:MAG: TatD family hydrolase [Lachnospiraceae bacterium]|nr:TatD family hydrolase [Lachnospiraceae bacterium]
MIFDTHAHFDDARYDDDRDKIIKTMQEHGVRHIVNVGASLRGCFDSVRLANKYDFIYPAIGIHPSDTAVLEEDEENFEIVKRMAALKEVVAVGEIGLDYYWDEPDREIQIKWFKRQLELARELKKPVNIHSRDAAKDTVDIMKEMHADEIGGIIHCFSYGVDMAKIFLDMGFYLGIGGVVTFKNGKKLKEVVEMAPIDRIVIETDSPYLSPEPYRGKRNNSMYLENVVKEIAKIKGLSEEEVKKITYENALKVYNLQEGVE